MEATCIGENREPRVEVTEVVAFNPITKDGCNTAHAFSNYIFTKRQSLDKKMFIKNHTES